MRRILEDAIHGPRCPGWRPLPQVHCHPLLTEAHPPLVISLTQQISLWFINSSFLASLTLWLPFQRLAVTCLLPPAILLGKINPLPGPQAPLAWHKVPADQLSWQEPFFMLPLPPWPAFLASHASLCLRKSLFPPALCQLDQSSGTFLKAVNLSSKLDFPFWLLPVNLVALLFLNLTKEVWWQIPQKCQIHGQGGSPLVFVSAAPYWLEKQH